MHSLERLATLQEALSGDLTDPQHIELVGTVCDLALADGLYFSQSAEDVYEVNLPPYNPDLVTWRIDPGSWEKIPVVTEDSIKKYIRPIYHNKRLTIEAITRRLFSLLAVFDEPLRTEFCVGSWQHRPSFALRANKLSQAHEALAQIVDKDIGSRDSYRPFVRILGYCVAGLYSKQAELPESQ